MGISTVMVDSTPAFALENICFTYTDGASSSSALHNVTMTVPRGQWITLLGANGSGKTTLSRLLAAVSAPTSGTLTILGHTLFDDDQDINRDAFLDTRHHVAYVTQNPQDQIVGSTVKDDVAFEPENLGWQPENTARAVYSSLHITEMSVHADDDPYHLSGGQQQRVAIASALAPHPDILILDEPFAYVDLVARSSILDALHAAHTQGTTIVIITHHPEIALLGDRIIELSHGEIRSDKASTEFTVAREEDTLPTQENIEALNVPVSLISSNNTNTVLETHDVSFSYDSSSPIIESTTLSISQGEFVTISGPNGSGKSTLAQLLAGALQPTRGTVTSHIPRIGFVMQRAEQQLFASSAYDDIAFGPRNLGLSEEEIRERVNQIVDLLSISPYLDKSVWQLSGGQQRLVAIAGILAMKPDVLILDEPTAALDEQTTHILLSLLSSLHRSGMTIIMITHSLEHIRKLATRAIVLKSNAFLHEDLQNIHVETAPQSRFDPRVLTLVSLCALFTSFALNSVWQLLLGLVFTSLFAAISHIGIKKLVADLKGFWIFIAFMGLFNLFFVQTGDEILHAEILRITDNGVWAGILYAGRFALMAVIAVSTLHILPPNRITDAAESLLQPIKKRGAPIHELSLMAALSLRFLPILTRDFHDLTTAQELRGATLSHGHISQRIRSLQALIVPSFANALRHADTLSIALDVRGFDNSAHRIPWRIMHVTWRDYVLISIYLIYVCSLIALAIL